MFRQLARDALVQVNKRTGSRRLRAELARAEAPYRIEIGAGPERHPGWISTDVSWRATFFLDATEAWPVPAGSVSHVYGDNMIEHVRMPAARRILANAHTAMASGGRIRLVTPDVRALARTYLDEPVLTGQIMERDRSKGYEIHHPVDIVRRIFQDDGHAFGYLWDEESLGAELEAAGFVDVSMHPAGATGDAAFEGLDSRVEGDVCGSILFAMEAVRP